MCVTDLRGGPYSNDYPVLSILIFSFFGFFSFLETKLFLPKEFFKTKGFFPTERVPQDFSNQKIFQTVGFFLTERIFTNQKTFFFFLSL